MNKYLETFNTWNKVAKAYQDKFMNLDIYNDTYDRFLDLLPEKSPSILDVGCGPGNICKYLLSKKTSIKLKGIDVAEQMVFLAQKNNPLADFELMDSRKLDLIKSNYDGIICGFCIPYLSQEDLSKLIVDCKNTLHESGVLYISYIDGDYAASDYIIGSTGSRVYFYYHNTKKLEQLLQEHSFEIKEVLHVDYKISDSAKETHTILIVKKNT